MNQLPDGLPTTVGQADSNPLTDSVISAAVNDAIRQTSFRDETPLPVTGSAPPVPQPGRPPMSSKATDDSVRMIAFGGMTLMASAGAGIVMVTSEFADPTVIAWICAAPVGLALPILALSRLVKRAGEAVPAEQHHHYNGPVHQHHQHVHTQNRLWGKSTTNL